jgi:hypothetical protein
MLERQERQVKVETIFIIMNAELTLLWRQSMKFIGKKNTKSDIDQSVLIYDTLC